MSETKESQSLMWATFCHLAAISGFIVTPIGFILGPLIIWLIKKDEFEFVNEQGKEALNFQISMLIYGIICFILAFILIGLLFLLVWGILEIIFIIIASVKANSGEHYRYPLTIRFIK